MWQIIGVEDYDMDLLFWDMNYCAAVNEMPILIAIQKFLDNALPQILTPQKIEDWCSKLNPYRLVKHAVPHYDLLLDPRHSPKYLFRAVVPKVKCCIHGSSRRNQKICPFIGTGRVRTSPLTLAWISQTKLLALLRVSLLITSGGT